MPSLLISFVGVGSRPRQSALTTDRFTMLVRHRPLFLLEEFCLRVINFLAHRNICWPSIISFMLIPIDDDMFLKDGSDSTRKRMSRFCSNVAIRTKALSTFFFALDMPCALQQCVCWDHYRKVDLSFPHEYDFEKHADQLHTEVCILPS